jgi:hypothetical protein
MQDFYNLNANLLPETALITTRGQITHPVSEGGTLTKGAEHGGVIILPSFTVQALSTNIAQRRK